MYTAADLPATNANQDDIDEDEDIDDEEEDEAEIDSGDETGRNASQTSMHDTLDMVGVEPSELIQLEMSDDIRVGSPNDGSNNLGSGFHLLAVSQHGNPSGGSDSYRAESTQRWAPTQDPLGSLQVQLPPSGKTLNW